jgi:hypothetical protein
MRERSPTDSSRLAPGKQAGSTPVVGRKKPDRKLRLHTIHHLDGRSIAARRARAVVKELVNTLGGPAAITPAQRQACERAGMYAAIAEDLAARKLAGLSVCGDELFRAEGVARRAVQAILANRPEPEPVERPGLAIARARWAERAKKENHNA